MNRLSEIQRPTLPTPDGVSLSLTKLGRFHEVGHRITGDRTRQSSRRGKSWGAGWECVHVAIDDASRIAFSQILPDETKKAPWPLLKVALAYYASLGIAVERVMTDNGPCYTSKPFVEACGDNGLKHVRTRPKTPNQRKGRTLHPDRPQRVGLRRHCAPANCQDGFIAIISTGLTEV